MPAGQGGNREPHLIGSAGAVAPDLAGVLVGTVGGDDDDEAAGGSAVGAGADVA